MITLTHNLASHGLVDLAAVRQLPLWLAERHHTRLVEDVRRARQERVRDQFYARPRRR